ncbi:MAG: MlaE family lipid ABC transporter permease subunit [Roseiarcus sp.]
MSSAPSIATQTTPDGVTLALRGDWTIDAGSALERAAGELGSAAKGHGKAVIDISTLGALDTAGAWVISRCQYGLARAGVEAALTGVREDHATLLREAGYRDFETPPPPRRWLALSLIADVGASIAGAFADIAGGLDFLGKIVVVFLAGAVNPRRWRITPVVFHIENFALRGTPIILMINFFVGVIVAQQGIFQLARFGAAAYSTELVAILALRELGVLLTSIMVAGRSGSSITAELGAMKMREEIDALRVMARDPLEVLVLPRLVALLASLPILTFLGDIAALFGGMVVAWAHGDVTPYSYLERLQQPYMVERFEVGMIKAPFMALVIGVIAAAEGFAVAGSAESLGGKVTSSVVKSIFLVIVLDGLFASFFVAVNF